jgi:hypothetical protein
VRDEAEKISIKDPARHHGMAFLHIPVEELVKVYNDEFYYGTKIESISCEDLHFGLFNAFNEHKLVNWLAMGHDHYNDFYGQYEGVHFGYGRKTGYGGYGPVGKSHGARVFEISLDPY